MIPTVMPVYNRAEMIFERGEGVYLFDKDGRRYLDFVSGIAVNALGHSHPHLVKALTDQAQKLWHTSNLFRIPDQERLAERLAACTFADTMFFTNSGVEAWECGVKVIRKHFYETGQKQRWRIVTCSQSFHGRTLAAISASKQEKLIKGFGPLVEGFDQAPFGDLDAMRAAITPETAALHIEPIQGEGGLRVASAEYLQGLRALANEHGLLLFLDEIQTGVGRTGKLFAHEWAGITPDVMCIAKGIGGGFPMGACLATEKAAVGMTTGVHGTTFGGNHLAMAVGNAVLDVVLAPGFMEHVQEMSQLLWKRLSDLVARHPKVLTEVRGKGLMLGLKCVVPNEQLLMRLRTHGMLAALAGDNVVRLLPPLILEPAHVEEALGYLDKACHELASA